MKNYGGEGELVKWVLFQVGGASKAWHLSRAMNGAMWMFVGGFAAHGKGSPKALRKECSRCAPGRA